MNHNELDVDQKTILYVYSKYSSEQDLGYLQYTAALVLFFYLMRKGVFPSYKDQLLVYDYKDSRRYMWEDKKFMADINIVRDHGFLNRARLKTDSYRDLNAHYCTTKGAEFVASNSDFKSISQKVDALLQCTCGNFRQIHLNDACPELGCVKCKNKSEKVEGFLQDLSQPIGLKYSAAYIG